MSPPLKVRDRVLMTRDFPPTLQAGHLGTVVKIRSTWKDGTQQISVWFDGLFAAHDLPASFVARADPTTRAHMSPEDRRWVRLALKSDD